MAITRLVLKNLPADRPNKPEAPLLAVSNLSRPYFPARTLPFSLLIHLVIFIGILSIQILRYPIGEPLLPEQIRRIERRMPRVVVFLPLIGGGSSSMVLPLSKPKPPEIRQTVARAPRKKGLAYPGPQPMVSNVPNPTNPIQTILQPALEKPPVLQPLLPLPNLVQIAGASHNQRLDLPEPPLRPPEPAKPAEPKLPAPPNEQPDVKAYMPPLPPLNLAPPTIEVPKLVLPPLKPPAPDPLPAPEEAIKSAGPAPKPIEKVKQPATPEPPIPAARGTDLQDLLVLSPMPSPPAEAVNIPAGEARGQFIISQEPNLGSPESEPGTKFESAFSSETANAKAAPAIAAAEAAPAATSTFGTNIGSVKGKNAPELGPSATQSSRPGSPSGAGMGSGAGPGTGAGVGPGKGPFPGITIVGGITDTGTPEGPALVKPAPRPLQTSYGLTIVSTETSGGGLPFFDVFSNEQVYTVYLDMRQTETDTAPAWTFEFALIPGTAYKVSAARIPSQSQQGLVLPFPAFKEQPILPAELVRKYRGQMVIVYGIVNVEGKFEQSSIKQSPDMRLNEQILAVLGKWVFRPARLNGEPVPVKALMGIPLWLPETRF